MDLFDLMFNRSELRELTKRRRIFKHMKEIAEDVEFEEIKENYESNKN